MLLCLLMAGMSVVGQTTYKRPKYKDDDVERVWAIDAHIGGGFYQNAHHTGAEVPKYHFGSTQNIGMLTKFHAEYYLPNTNFSLKAGYEHEEVMLLLQIGGFNLMWGSICFVLLMQSIQLSLRLLLSRLVQWERRRMNTKDMVI